VHGDIGPDNVLAGRQQVVAVVDFTPHVLPVLFAASPRRTGIMYTASRPPAQTLTASRAAMAQARLCAGLRPAPRDGSIIIRQPRRRCLQRPTG
jgi:hypothetical protein